MERIISYQELPFAKGESIYLRMETDPKLYLSLLSKGYHIVNHISDAEENTIYVTGKRQDNESTSADEYVQKVNLKYEGILSDRGFAKPKTVPFSYHALVNHQYSIPFVFKNERLNGGKEKFLIATKEDYDNLVRACEFLIERKYLLLSPYQYDDVRNRIDYQRYLDLNFSVQEYVETPTEFCTSMRVLSSSSHDLLCAILKYKIPEEMEDDTTLLGFLLREVFPLSTKSIVSNTLSGGDNIFVGESLSDSEKRILDAHHIDSYQFEELIDASLSAHEQCQSELGILCGSDFIYDKDKEQWYFMEFHSKPMVGSYSMYQGLSYETRDDHIIADGRVRATALSLELKKTR